MAEDALSNLINQVRKYVELGRRVMRRWWIIAVFGVLGVGGSVAFALNATRIYQSRALVAWKMSINLEDLGRDSTGRPRDNYLRNQVGQLVASNTLLLKIAHDLNLYPKERPVAAPEVILEYMRNAIHFNQVGPDSVWIAFEYKDPKLAQKVTARLVKEFIEENVRDKLRAAKGTQAFMEGEAKKVKEALDLVEGKLAQFIADHPEFQVYLTGGISVPHNKPRRLAMGRRPGGNRHYLPLKQTPELRSALARKGKLEARLLALSPRGNTQVAQVQAELQRARLNLAALRRKYTDQHPDVQQARTYLRQVQQRAIAARRSQQQQSAEVVQIRRRIASLDETIARLSTRRRVATRKPRGKTPTANETSSEPALTGSARLEKQWYSLSGDRSVMRAKYEEVQAQLQRSKISAGAIRKQAEKEYAIVDPASMPGKPIRPSRKKIVLAGSALGFMVGIGLATLLVLFDPRIYNEDDLKKAANLPVLAQIPKEV